MALMNFKLHFHGHGFDLEKDISKETKNRVIDEFMAMYNQYVEMANSVQEKINETWERYERIKRMDDILENDHWATKAALCAMGLKETDDYYDWMEKWYKEIAEAVDLMAAMSGFMLKGNIFRDGELPVYGVKFKNHPDWTMDFTMEQVD